jgi:hypothetical protein
MRPLTHTSEYEARSYAFEEGERDRERERERERGREREGEREEERERKRGGGWHPSAMEERGLKLLVYEALSY